jgi:hypothetical protein
MVLNERSADDFGRKTEAEPDNHKRGKSDFWHCLKHYYNGIEIVFDTARERDHGTEQERERAAKGKTHGRFANGDNDVAGVEII